MPDQPIELSEATTCGRCATTVLFGAVFCHQCGLKLPVGGGYLEAQPPVGETEAMVVKLQGLYDDHRREELALALIPVLAGISRRIDMTDVEHIDVAALLSLVPLMEEQLREGAAPIEVIGMNADVSRSLARPEFENLFRVM